MQRFALAAALTAFLFIPATAWATPVVIAQIDSGSGLAGNGTANAEGKSIALGAAPLGLIGWDDIEFNWYTWSGGTVPTNSNLVPLASGNVFILTQLYTGTPTALSSSTAGFVAESTGIVADGSGEAYTFAANVDSAGRHHLLLLLQRGGGQSRGAVSLRWDRSALPKLWEPFGPLSRPERLNQSF